VSKSLGKGIENGETPVCGVSVPRKTVIGASFYAPAGELLEAKVAVWWDSVRLGAGPSLIFFLYFGAFLA
jgi:hypothetical protein